MSEHCTLRKLVATKLSQWESEAYIAACEAFRQGRQAKPVTYPSGLKVMRFAEPFADFGMHYEISVEAWNEITANPQPNPSMSTPTVTIEPSHNEDLYAIDTASGTVIAARSCYCNPAALAQLILDVERLGYSVDWHESTVAKPESR